MWEFIYIYSCYWYNRYRVRVSPLGNASVLLLDDEDDVIRQLRPVPGKREIIQDRPSRWKRNFSSNDFPSSKCRVAEIYAHAPSLETLHYSNPDAALPMPMPRPQWGKKYISKKSGNPSEENKSTVQPRLCWQVFHLMKRPRTSPSHRENGERWWWDLSIIGLVLVLGPSSRVIAVCFAVVVNNRFVWSRARAGAGAGAGAIMRRVGFAAFCWTALGYITWWVEMKGLGIAWYEPDVRCDDG